MFNLAVWKFLLVDLGGSLVWAGAYIGAGWMFRRQLEDVAAAMSRFGSWFGVALGAGLSMYLISKLVRRRHFDPRENQKTCVVGEVSDVAPPRLAAPADEPVAARQVPRRRTPCQTRHRSPLCPHQILQVLAHGLPVIHQNAPPEIEYARPVNVGFDSGELRSSASIGEYSLAFTTQAQHHICSIALKILGEVYGYDEAARAQRLSPEQRLHFHQEHSGPVMEKLHIWLNAQFDERKVEPNSGLGTAIAYLLKYWDRLTLFLRQAGAPLDNNVCERALKKSILHRKNSLFYKTRNGAQIGDLFMSLIHTCELNGADPFDYLHQLQRHAEALKQTPSEWMPWNYRETLARTGALLDAA
jgi:hypothetical protein